MDDYSLNSLTESKNEWCSRLVSILTFNMIEGINSIYKESIKLCLENQEENKYLMTFQNLLSKIPDWNMVTIETERKRIENVSGCKYLEDLITCVHIIQLKALTCIRVGLKQKKIDIDIPSIDKFIHKVYINTARKLYSAVYLFEKNILPLQKQKNNREIEILIKEAILITIRDNIPVEQILRVYIDETEEQEEIIEDETPKEDTINFNNLDNQNVNKENLKNVNKENLENINKENLENVNKENLENNEDKIEKIANEIKTENKVGSVDFSNIDNIVNSDGNIENIMAPKDLETLEKNNKEKINKDDENDEDKLKIGEDLEINLDELSFDNEIKLDDIEEL